MPSSLWRDDQWLEMTVDWDDQPTDTTRAGPAGGYDALLPVPTVVSDLDSYRA